MRQLPYPYIFDPFFDLSFLTHFWYPDKTSFLVSFLTHFDLLFDPYALRDLW